MVKEFIIKMRDDNEQKIHSLESEMSELVGDLSSTEQTLEKMLREKKSDSYIFSPRSVDFQIDEKIKTKQAEIRELNQRIEYVRQMMEERLKNREEYNKLFDEIDRQNVEDQYSNGIKSSSSDQFAVNEEDVSLVCEKQQTGTTAQKESIDKESIEKKSEERGSTEKKPAEKELVNKESDASNERNDTSNIIELDRMQLLSFLQDLYKNSESCLALLNGNKNRCKIELRKAMKSINEFKKMIETKDD